MSRPETLLEGLCGHALSLGADSIEVEHEDGHERVYARKGGSGIRIANYASSSNDARELRTNLYAAARKPVRAVLGGRLSILTVEISESFGEDCFSVSIRVVPERDPATPAKFTARQGQYLAYIYHYSKIHRQAPSECDLQNYFRVSAPSVHEMLKTLQRSGLIERTPGQARSIRVLVAAEQLPELE
ncbi:MAG TPA: hypothetical protein VML19_17445 [Verrucomicrobiae bacterium]|nr:hypothetical protein [Verrucomicrobiae bacterium]